MNSLRVQPANVHLSIELESEPIRGSLSTGDTEPREFYGWIELVEAIEQARHPNRGSANASARILP